MISFKFFRLTWQKKVIKYSRNEIGVSTVRILCLCLQPKYKTIQIRILRGGILWRFLLDLTWQTWVSDKLFSRGVTRCQTLGFMSPLLPASLATRKETRQNRGGMEYCSAVVNIQQPRFLCKKSESDIKFRQRRHTVLTHCFESFWLISASLY